MATSAMWLWFRVKNIRNGLWILSPQIRKAAEARWDGGACYSRMALKYRAKSLSGSRFCLEPYGYFSKFTPVVPEDFLASGTLSVDDRHLSSCFIKCALNSTRK